MEQRKLKILSFGEIIWDIFPTHESLGGALLNFAAHAAMQGVESHLASAVGDDLLGKKAKAEIAALGLSVDRLSVCELPTGKAEIQLNEQSIPTFCIHFPSAYDRIHLEGIREDYDLLAIGSLALRRQENRRTLTSWMKENPLCPVFCDLNLRAPHYDREGILFCLSHAHYLKLSAEELWTVNKLLFDTTLSEEDSLRRLCHSYPTIRLVALTKGAEGSVAYTPSTDIILSAPAHKVEVVSTVGAGDSYSATLMTHLLKGYPLSECLYRASLVSALTCASPMAIPSYDPSVFWET
ncbi:MAG: hypothetical protein IKA76_03700 [Clostridia bacterium]|nr:hypothetical protein [Clostridia bacterium]